MRLRRFPWSVVLVHTDDDFYYFSDGGGNVVTLQELEEKIALTEPFYAQVSDEEIRAHNEESHRRRYEEQEGPASAPREKKPRPGYVYLVQSDAYFKIGVSKYPDKRIAQLGTQPPFKLEIIDTVLVNDPYWLEGELHQRLDDVRVEGEWFELSPQDVDYVLKVFAWARENMEEGT